MQKVYQTRFSRNGDKGNCWEACLASICDCSINDVPNIQDSENWLLTTNDFLLSRGLDFETWNKELKPDGWSIVLGKSPRGEYGHSCIAFDGEIFHDPYPSNDGLKEIEQYWTIEKL